MAGLTAVITAATITMATVTIAANSHHPKPSIMDCVVYQGLLIKTEHNGMCGIESFRLLWNGVPLIPPRLACCVGGWGGIPHLALLTTTRNHLPGRLLPVRVRWHDLAHTSRGGCQRCVLGARTLRGVRGTGPSLPNYAHASALPCQRGGMTPLSLKRSTAHLLHRHLI